MIDVHSGKTKSVSKIITPLYEANLKECGFPSPERLLSQMISVATASSSEESVKIITELLSQKRPPRYRYIVYYLLEYFKGELQDNSLFTGILDKQAEDVFKEIEKHEADSNKNRYDNAPRLKVLTDLIFEQAINRGFTAKANKKAVSYIYASLVDAQSKWKRDTLCRDLFSEDSSQWDEQKFFALALILSAEHNFIQQYLTRVLMRKDLNVWKIDELLVFVLSQLHDKLPPNIYGLYSSLYQLYGYSAYNTKECSYPSEPTKHVTDMAYDLLEKLKSSSKSSANHFVSITAEVKHWFFDYKTFVIHNNDQQHSSERKFVELNKNIRRFLGERDEIFDKEKRPDDEGYYDVWDKILTSSSEFSIFQSCETYARSLNCNITVSPIIRDLVKGHYPLMSKESNLKNKKNKVYITREELLTAAFLNYVSQYEGSPQVYNSSADIMHIINSFIKEMDFTLGSVGFDSIYLLNPHDCFLSCLSLLDDPFEFYFELWSSILNADAKATAAKKEKDKKEQKN